jgi:outer membrane protein OmpA-like peptidoglycan-associated protein
MNKPRNIRPTMLLLALIAATGTALAGDVMLYRQGEKPSPQDVARMLRGEQAQSADEEEIAMPIRTRGIKLLPDVQEPEAKAPRKEIERIARDPAPRQGAGEPTSFALQVQFPFNSAEIQPDMLEPLDAVAEGIRLAGRQIGIVIEGHTDASGSAEYNLQLSRRRAKPSRTISCCVTGCRQAVSASSARANTIRWYGTTRSLRRTAACNSAPACKES